MRVSKKRSFRRLALGSYAAEILLSLVATSDEVVAAIGRPYLASRMGAGIAREYVAERKYLAERQALRRLQEKKLILRQQTTDGIAFVLTERGAVEALRQRVLQAGMLEGNADCMVMFDIPERHRALRKELAEFLEASGFIRRQKSVFISPFDAFEPLAQLFALKKVDKWVAVYRAERITHNGRSAPKRQKRTTSTQKRG